MAKYVFIYTGGEKAAPQEDWISWLRGLGDSVAEAGYPFFGESATVNSSGVISGGASKAGGYTIVNADSIDDATAMAKGCPIVPSVTGFERAQLRLDYGEWLKRGPRCGGRPTGSRATAPLAARAASAQVQLDDPADRYATPTAGPHRSHVSLIPRHLPLRCRPGAPG